MKNKEKQNTGQKTPAFVSAPSIPRLAPPELRAAMCFDDSKLYVVLCGCLPTLLANLPRMSFFSPADDHECTVMFTPDPFIGDNIRLNEVYAVMDELFSKKQLWIKEFREQIKRYVECKEGEVI